MNATIRKGLITLAAGAAALAISGVALASYYFDSMGSSSLDGQYARAHEDDSSFTTVDLKCGSNQRVESVGLRHGGWGLYDSVDRVSIKCVSASSPTTTVATHSAGFSSAPWGASSTVSYTGCGWDEPFMNGLDVVYDSYVKDFGVHCATTADEDENGRALWPQEGSIWVLHEWYTDSNDDNEDLSCNAGKVMTGLRIRYRSDADEIAVTRVQLYCATINFD